MQQELAAAKADSNVRLRAKYKGAILNPMLVDPNNAAQARIIEQERLTQRNRSMEQLHAHKTALDNKVNTHLGHVKTSVYALKQLAPQLHVMNQLVASKFQQHQAKEAAKDQMHQLRLQQDQIDQAKRQVRAQQLMASSGGLLVAGPQLSLLPSAFLPPAAIEEPEDSIDITQTDDEEEPEEEPNEEDRNFLVD
jgi:hypothetical protein